MQLSVLFESEPPEASKCRVEVELQMQCCMYAVRAECLAGWQLKQGGREVTLPALQSLQGQDKFGELQHHHPVCWNSPPAVPAVRLNWACTAKCSAVNAVVLRHWAGSLELTHDDQL
mgnify:CR=1 FL=1